MQQLEFPLDLTAMSLGTTYAPVENITVPFEWESVDYLLSLPSVDFGTNGLRYEYNREIKRSDRGFEDLLEDLQDQGFLDPIFVHPPHNRVALDNTGEHLGNGHHRLIAAHDLGWTHVPVTRNRDHQWRMSGTSAQ